ncbi:TPA: hypothetical protein N0F65_003792 [Lagenidium giganteum]|uniref:EGF-like domain-containing protein n=1 Tax=Lagenidium giganteum TaxID=4803 RepID=A0AAV2YZQ4_9STRA|nr:TPA: hypothetical protein N0F65_003792 [Lagenidium giganteum]
MLLRRLVLAAALALCGVGVTRAEEFGKACNDNSDCGEGATCVVGDSESPVLRCVAGTSCGADRSGSCPSDPTVGQLACVWQKSDCSKNKACAKQGNEWGIFKCMTLDRCDKYNDGDCSRSCKSDNGKQCNGAGSCQLLTGTGSSKPEFGCQCFKGWNGTLCENVVDDSCVVDVGQCGAHGTCEKGACTCKNGYTGSQCEIAPSNSSSSSGSGSRSGKHKRSGSGSLDGSVGGSGKSHKKNGTSSSSKAAGSKASGSKNSGSKKKDNAGSKASTSESKKSGSNSTPFIIVGILAALFVIGALIFAMYSRKKKREQEAAAAAFGARTNSDVDADAVGGPDTPKQNIVIM